MFYMSTQTEHGFWVGSDSKLSRARLGEILAGVNLELDHATSRGFIKLLHKISQLCQTHYERIDWEIMGDRYGGNIVESEVGKSDIPLKNHVSSNLVGPLDTHDEILKIFNEVLEDAEEGDWVPDKGVDNFANFTAIKGNAASIIANPSRSHSSAKRPLSPDLDTGPLKRRRT